MITRIGAADAPLLEQAVRRFRGTDGGTAFVRTPGALAFVATRDEEIAGWCWGHLLARPDSAAMVYLHHLEVAVEHRRSGIGRRLLQAFMAAGVEAGATKMFLTTGAGNTAARRLYESLGAGPATQGPTMNYWFPLDSQTSSSIRRREAALPRALLLTGVTGVGKSTVAGAIGRLLTAAGLVTAVVDTDALAQFGPSPGRSGFHDDLKCANLAAVWANFRAAGAHFIVVSAGVDSAPLRDRYAGSLADCELQVVRLVAPADTIRKRLAARDPDAMPNPHLSTLIDQEAALSVEDFTAVNDRPAPDVAGEIIARAGWSAAPR